MNIKETSLYRIERSLREIELNTRVSAGITVIGWGCIIGYILTNLL